MSEPVMSEDKFSKLNAYSTTLIAIFTVLLATIGWLQWRTLTATLTESTEQQRPFVFTKGNIAIANAPKTQYGEFLFLTTWVNNGNREAVVSFEMAGGDDVNFANPYISSVWTIGPKSEFEIEGYHQFPDQIFKYFANRPDRLFRILGRAKYHDPVFNIDRETRFCVYAKNLSVENWQNFKSASLKGDAVPCPEVGSNCIDTECQRLPGR